MASTVTIDLRHVARGLDFPLRQVQAVVELLDEGNTVPFITRYRKDQTGGLDEEQIREIQDRLAKMRLLAERKQTVLRSIEAQGKLTEKLAKQILSATTTKRLEDLYLPFKPKKQTLATLARSRGLEELATEILEASPSAVLDLDARARDFANPDRQVPSGADALLGAGHILAEQFSERADLRQRLREILQKSGKIVTTQIVSESQVAAAAVPPAEPAVTAPAEVATAPESATPPVSEPSATAPPASDQEPATEPHEPDAPPVAVAEPPPAVVSVTEVAAEKETVAVDAVAVAPAASDGAEQSSPAENLFGETASDAPTESQANTAPAASDPAAGESPPPLAQAAHRVRDRERAKRRSKQKRKPRSASSTNAASRPSATTSITPKTSRESRRTASWPSIGRNGPKSCG